MSRTLHAPQRPGVRSGAANQRTDSGGKVRSVRITLTTSVAALEHLRKLVTLGLYGRNPSECAERLLCQALQAETKRKRAALVDFPEPFMH